MKADKYTVAKISVWLLMAFSVFIGLILPLINSFNDSGLTVQVPQFYLYDDQNQKTDILSQSDKITLLLFFDDSAESENQLKVYCDIAEEFKAEADFYAAGNTLQTYQNITFLTDSDNAAENVFAISQYPCILVIDENDCLADVFLDYADYDSLYTCIKNQTEKSN